MLYEVITAKSEGRACYRFFSDELTRAAQERLAIESRLRQALVSQEFSLHYQPLIEIASGRIVGAEALLRWHTPGEENPPPSRFIPIAEETGLISSIGEWVLNEACSQAQAWHQAGLPILNLAVNLSPRQFRHGNIGGMVERTLAQTGYPAERLTLEITEGALMTRELESTVILVITSYSIHYTKLYEAR